MLIAYDQLDPPPHRSSSSLATVGDNKPLVKAYTGQMTASAKKRLIRAINLLIAISKRKKAIHFDTKKEFWFRVNFITLTLPSPQGSVSDKELKKKCLKPFLEYWQDKHSEFTYVWRAERQGNGNLHFHLLSNTYLHYQFIRDVWNSKLNLLGFIDEFQKNHHHSNPNSTDVHAVTQIRHLAAYMAKYMAKKEEEGQTIEGRLWDCSARLKTRLKCAWPMSNADADIFEQIFKKSGKKSFATDHCGGVRLSEPEMHELFPDKWKSEYSAYLEKIRTSPAKNSFKKKIQVQEGGVIGMEST